MSVKSKYPDENELSNKIAKKRAWNKKATQHASLRKGVLLATATGLHMANALGHEQATTIVGRVAALSGHSAEYLDNGDSALSPIAGGVADAATAVTLAKDLANMAVRRVARKQRAQQFSRRHAERVKATSQRLNAQRPPHGVNNTLPDASQQHASQQHVSQQHVSQQHASQHVSQQHASQHVSQQHASQQHASQQHASQQHASQQHASQHVSQEHAFQQYVPAPEHHYSSQEHLPSYPDQPSLHPSDVQHRTGDGRRHHNAGSQMNAAMAHGKPGEIVHGPEGKRYVVLADGSRLPINSINSASSTSIRQQPRLGQAQPGQAHREEAHREEAHREETQASEAQASEAQVDEDEYYTFDAENLNQSEGEVPRAPSHESSWVHVAAQRHGARVARTPALDALEEDGLNMM